jgi:hypothetical protein
MKVGLADLIKEQLKECEDLEEARYILESWTDFISKYIHMQDYIEEHKAKRKPRKQSYYQRNKERLRTYQRAYVKKQKLKERR